MQGLAVGFDLHQRKLSKQPSGNRSSQMQRPSHRLWRKNLQKPAHNRQLRHRL
jgi:hypothetical protein